MTNELLLGTPAITLMAKGTAALLLVFPVSVLLIAIAWCVVMARRKS